MKNLIVASVVVALGGFGMAPQTAQAGNNEVWAAIGGFVGGVIVGSALESDSNSSIIVETRHRHHPRHGHWKVVSVRTWVPGQWVVTHDRWGRPFKQFQRGHYAFVKQRVWVDGRRDRSYGYAGGRDRFEYDRHDRRNRRG